MRPRRVFFSELNHSAHFVVIFFVLSSELMSGSTPLLSDILCVGILFVAVTLFRTLHVHLKMIERYPP